MERYENGEPCEHPGCLESIQEPCENCGRFAGRNNDFIETFGDVLYSLQQAVQESKDQDSLRLLSMHLATLKDEVDAAFYREGIKKL